MASTPLATQWHECGVCFNSLAPDPHSCNFCGKAYCLACWDILSHQAGWFGLLKCPNCRAVCLPVPNIELRGALEQQQPALPVPSPAPATAAAPAAPTPSPAHAAAAHTGSLRRRRASSVGAAPARGGMPAGHGVPPLAAARSQSRELRGDLEEGWSVFTPSEAS